MERLTSIQIFLQKKTLIKPPFTNLRRIYTQENIYRRYKQYILKKLDTLHEEIDKSYWN